MVKFVIFTGEDGDKIAINPELVTGVMDSEHGVSIFDGTTDPFDVAEKFVDVLHKLMSPNGLTEAEEKEQTDMLIKGMSSDI